jgi:hypothetical protein
VLVHSHCYRADEILMLIRASQQFGFQIATLQHVLEGYKVAREMAEAKVGGSTFGDWWAYKIEAYDGIPQNAALMDQAGIVSSLNSDSAEMMRRLYGEAAKSVRYAGMDPVRALDLVTLFPAEQLGIGDRIGSIEVGKDADLVLLNGDPLSSLARVEWTMVDGEIEFERRDAFDLALSPAQGARSRREGDRARRGPIAGGAVDAIAAARTPPVTADVARARLLMQGGRILGARRRRRDPGRRAHDRRDGKHVWPGMIALGHELGLLEIGSVAATDDQAESAAISPTCARRLDQRRLGAHRRHAAQRRHALRRRAAGGGPLRGQSAVCACRATRGKSSDARSRHAPRRVPEPRPTRKEEEEGDEVKELEKLFEDAREYAACASAAPAHAEPAVRSATRRARAVRARREEGRAARAATRRRSCSRSSSPRSRSSSRALRRARRLEGGRRHRARAGAGGRRAGARPALERFDPYDAPYSQRRRARARRRAVAIMSDDAENPRNLAFHAAMACALRAAARGGPARDHVLPGAHPGLERSSAASRRASSRTCRDRRRPARDPLARDRAVHRRPQVPLENRQTQLYDKYPARGCSGCRPRAAAAEGQAALRGREPQGSLEQERFIGGCRRRTGPARSRSTVGSRGRAEARCGRGLVHDAGWWD